MVIMIPRRGTSAILVASPGWTVTVRKLSRCAVRVDIIAQRENGTRDIVEQFCRGFIIVMTAISDIARPDEDRVGRLSENIHGRRERTSQCQAAKDC
jgi:hypothetical protein